MDIRFVFGICFVLSGLFGVLFGIRKFYLVIYDKDMKRIERMSMLFWATLIFILGASLIVETFVYLC